MKKAILSIGMLFGCCLLSAQETSVQNPVNPNAPEIVFETETIDYGTIEHNANGVREFKFKNTGKEPLVISNGVGSCGCTVPEWPKEPIKPGESGVVKVKYATDRVGAFEKTVTLTSNAKSSTKVLKIKGTVKPDPTPAEQPAGTPANAATPTPAPAATPATPAPVKKNPK